MHLPVAEPHIGAIVERDRVHGHGSPPSMRLVGKVLVADLNHLDPRAYIRNPGLDLDPGAGDHEPRRELLNCSAIG